MTIYSKCIILLRYVLLLILEMIGQTSKRAAAMDPRHCRII